MTIFGIVKGWILDWSEMIKDLKSVSNQMLVLYKKISEN